MATCDCGNEIAAPNPQTAITASGGWCAPASTMYELPNLTADMCGSCRAEFLMAINGIDPRWAHMPIPRGGIQFRYGGR